MKAKALNSLAYECLFVGPGLLDSAARQSGAN
jgi:hypothetical protein